MLHRPFKSVLVANRGEIAARIINEAKKAGLRAIAVYSDADREAWHVKEADTAVHIGPSQAAESYLSIPKILAVAKQTGAEAIHPGYGFLSENADFAQSVIDAGLVWIGPSPDAIRAMGDKGNAKEIARKEGVPVIPGYDGDDQADATLLAEAKKIGWPVLIKAALGGGGRGQRKVTEESTFLEALASARREALSAFASDRMILEKALENVRHIEIQIFGDSHGNLIHLGERDCSIQRRNQKIIEEAPALGVSEDLRNKMGTAAVALARAVNYTNAGTVEFLLDRDGSFYFLEMNTRIQVEHPVTEEVTGTNLIAMQFEVSNGSPVELIGSGHNTMSATVLYGLPNGTHPDTDADRLDLQGSVNIEGHAIEARLCAEDPSEEFKPQTGTAHGIWGNIRIDSADVNISVSGDYDSMLAKIISSAPTRPEAIAKLVKQLRDLMPTGMRTNRNFLLDVLASSEFQTGRCTVDWLSRRKIPVETQCTLPHAFAAAIFLDHGAGMSWRSNGLSRSLVNLRERNSTMALVVENFRCNGHEMSSVKPIANDLESAGDLVSATMSSPDGNSYIVFARFSGNQVHITLNGRDALFEDITYAPAERKDTAGTGTVRAPMAGKIIKISAEPGTKVAKGDLLVILEAMKMEHELRAAADGTVDSLTVKPGDQVSMRQVLVTLKS